MSKQAIEAARTASGNVPWRERLLLLECALHKPIPQILLERTVLDDEALARFDELLSVRQKGIPIQLLLGNACFLDFQLEVEPGVFIPRPETAQLVEWTTDKLPREPKVIVELGIGTGAISIALARIFTDASIVAVDINPQALSLAKRNAKRLRVASRIKFVLGDLFDFHEAEKYDRHVDLIISNPPYIPTGLLDTLPSEVVDFDPIIALDGGPDGFAVIERILDNSLRYLSAEGVIALEIDPLLEEPLKNYMADSACSCLTGVDSFKNLRFLLVRLK